jgi:hypothetical protein
MEKKILPHLKISLSKVQCPQIYLDISRRENPNQTDHILTDRRNHSSILDIQSFRTAECDTDHYLEVAKIRERQAVNKQVSHKFHMERFILKKLNDVEGKEKYRFEVSNKSGY